jgi:hypothetical protein
MSLSSQFSGVQHRPTAAKDKLNATLDSQAVKSGSPSDEQLRVSYGEIFKVHEERSTVDITLFGRNTDEAKEGEKIFEVPLLHPLHFYHLVYGQLRAGLCVRLFWRGGRQKPGREAIAEVISNNACTIFRSGKKEYEPNTINTGPWQIFSGGLG